MTTVTTEISAEEIVKTIGNTIHESRVNQGLSLATLGGRANLSKQAIHQAECGQTRLAAVHLFRLALALGEPIERFFPSLSTQN